MKIIDLDVGERLLVRAGDEGWVLSRPSGDGLLVADIDHPETPPRAEQVETAPPDAKGYALVRRGR